MKIIKLNNNLEFLINDEDVEKIYQAIKTEGFIKLKTGDIINTKYIVAITDPDVVPYYEGYYRLDKDERFFVRDGQRIYLENKNADIQYKPHPKYKEMVKRLAEKMIMLNDKDRTSAQEEAAREERKI